MTKSCWEVMATPEEIEKAKATAVAIGADPKQFFKDQDSLRATLVDLGQQLIAAYGPEEASVEVFEKLRDQFTAAKAKSLLVLLAYDFWMIMHSGENICEAEYMAMTALWTYANDFEHQISRHMKRVLVSLY